MLCSITILYCTCFFFLFLKLGILLLMFSKIKQSISSRLVNILFFVVGAFENWAYYRLISYNDLHFFKTMIEFFFCKSFFKYNMKIEKFEPKTSYPRKQTNASSVRFMLANFKNKTNFLVFKIWHNFLVNLCGYSTVMAPLPLLQSRKPSLKRSKESYQICGLESIETYGVLGSKRNASFL